MSITTVDGLVSALATSKDQQLFFPSATTVAGGWVWLNYAVTSSFGILAIPNTYSGGGTTYNQTAGVAGYPKWSSGVAASYIGRIGATFATAGTVHVYDMLWACSSFSGIVTTPQVVSSFSGLPARNATGVGAEIWIFCTTATGATASNITVQYTNSAGVSGRNTVATAMITSMPAFRMFQVPLQSGDVGVQSIQSITLSASTGTAGSFGVVIMDRLCAFSAVVPNVGNSFDFAALGMPQISDSSVLNFIHQGTTTSSGIIMGQVSILQG